MVIKGYVKTTDGNTGNTTANPLAFVYTSDENGNAISGGQGGAAVYANQEGYFVLMPVSTPAAITVMRPGDTKQSAQKFINITQAWEGRINLLVRTTPKTVNNSNTAGNSSKKTNTILLYLAAAALGIFTGIESNKSK